MALAGSTRLRVLRYSSSGNCDEHDKGQDKMLNDLSGRSAFVTGSTMGIGASISDSIRLAGASVVQHGLSRDELNRKISNHRVDQARCVFGDLAEDLPTSSASIAEQALEIDPEIDLLVCNAGIYIDQPFLEMDYQTFQRTMDVNVGAVFAMVQTFARHWTSKGMGGTIVVTGSINGRLAEPTHVAYDTSKGAIEAMVRSLAVTLAPLQIRVNGVAPGLFETPLTTSAIQAPGVRDWMKLHTPNGEVPGPKAAAGTVVFLLSEASKHMVGQMLFVDGGMSIWQQPDCPDCPDSME